MKKISVLALLMVALVFGLTTYASGEGEYGTTPQTVQVQLAQAQPQTAAQYNNRGGEYLNKGDYNSAIADFTQAIRLDPNNATQYGNRGFAYYLKKDYNSAIADFTQAIRLNPNNALAYNTRGLAYNDKGDYDSAIADYTQAIRLLPNNATPYINRAIAYNHTGNFTQARADVNRALQIEPNNQAGKDLDATLRQREAEPSDTISITSVKLYEEFKANEVRANTQYKGKTLSVTGKILELASLSSGRYYVTLNGGGLFDWVWVYFLPSETSKLGNLSIGQNITIIGTCEGRNPSLGGDVQIMNSRIQ